MPRGEGTYGPEGIARRSFLKGIAALAASFPALLPGCGDEEEPFGPADPAPPRPWAPPPPFGEAELATLGRALERILPSEDGPGAREASVLSYVEAAVALEAWRDRLPSLKTGAAALDALARRDWSAPAFASLDDRSADFVLEFVQGGGADQPDFSGPSFVHDLVVLALEGFLGDPIHGGNAAEVGWKFIGYAPDGPRPCHGG